MSGDAIRRREFVALLGSAAVACPFVARAQQGAMPVIGYLYSGALETSGYLIAAFQKGLNETDHVEGRNFTIEFRFANNDENRLPELAAELVRRQVAVIVAPGTPAGALAAKAATSMIPIVFRTGADPVQLGLVPSLNRPGGNVTGINTMATELATKQLGLLHELVPKAQRFAMLVNPSNPNAQSIIREVQTAATGLGCEIEILTAVTIREIDAAFVRLLQTKTEALLVGPEGLFNNRRVQLVTLAARHAVPAIYPVPDFTEIGGLMSYGASPTDQFRQVGIYAGRILRGEKPADLPVLRAAKFELIINLQTARTLGLDVPVQLLARADEVIE